MSLLGTAAASLLLGALAHTGAPSSEDGAVAPAGRWYTAGGCAARTRQSADGPLFGELEEVWSVSFEGELEGEPLCWDGVVVASYRDRDEERVLVALDLLTGGRRGAAETFDTTAPLAPSLWGDTVLVRSEPDVLYAYRLRPGGLRAAWRRPLGAELGPPLLFGAEIYVICGDDLVALELGRRDERWRHPGRFRGSVSLRGGEVYAVRYDEMGNAFVVGYLREGEVFARQGVGHHQGAVPGPGTRPFVALTRRECLVYHALPLQMPEGSTRSLGLPFPLPEKRVQAFSVASLGHSTAAAAAGEGWIGLAEPPGEGRAWLSIDPLESESRVLAFSEHHAELLAHTGPPCVTGGTAWIAGHLVDLSTLRVLAKLRGGPESYVIPARDTVLLVEPPGRISAWRARRSERAPEVSELPTGDLCAVLADGTVLRGKLELDAAEGLLSGHVDRRKREVPLADVQAVVADGRRIVHAAGAQELAHGLARLVEDELAAELLELAYDARLTRDPDLVEGILDEALALGAEGGLVERVQKQVESLRDRPRKIDEERAEDARRRAGELATFPAAELFGYASALPGEAPFAWERVLLERALREDPAHEGARGRVRELLPEGLVLPDDFDAAEWLAFADACRRKPVRLLPMPTDEKGVDAVERQVGRAGETWRRDLVGFHSERLLIVTPVARPGAIARCLLLGELVCEALEEIFAGGEVKRDERAPLVVQLFPTKEEYLKVSAESDRRLRRGRAPREAASGLSWTAGHYDLFARVSRLYVPDGDEGWESVMETVAHELTHHWIRQRCPLFTEVEVRRTDPRLPGFWIVEGFASLLEEFRFDLEAMTWESVNPRSRRLGLVANSPPEALLDWQTVLRTSQVDFHKLGLEPTARVDTAWWLGKQQQLSQRSQFYNQAAAVCHYLFHAEDGALRDELIEYVRRFYVAEADGLDAEALIRLDSEALGRSVVEYARSIQAE